MAYSFFINVVGKKSRSGTFWGGVVKKLKGHTMQLWVDYRGDVKFFLGAMAFSIMTFLLMWLGMAFGVAI